MTAETPSKLVQQAANGPLPCPLTVHRLAGDRLLTLLLPTLGVPAVKHNLLLETLAAQGYHSAICELPGTCDSHPQPDREADYGYSDLVFTWIPMILAALQQEFGREPELILGHSIGGQTLTLAAHASTRLLGYFPGRQLRFGGREAATLLRDWGTGILRGQLVPELRIPAASLLARKPIFLCIEDDLFAPGNAIRRLADLVDGEVREIPASYLTGNPHASWIKNPGPVLEIALATIRGARACT